MGQVQHLDLNEAPPARLVDLDTPAEVLDLNEAPAAELVVLNQAPPEAEAITNGSS